MSACCIKASVTGKVQGVGYRRAVQKQALQAGITGHAKNLTDGRVEVLMCGERHHVNMLGKWLWQGPANAQVTHVEYEALAQCHAPEAFTTH
ncbi:Acylphosphate phosphohydrolase, putative [Halomonas citrativorans]|uniref:acylphosphatase n=1 Tax=Halomonas citrativorans TaxID=2742612 RepID=A0A1R4HNU4_9GAMM|nr:acylphosphatase [Halomonas citrativorans]SJN09217.1 Acylphosphate phosphohydrolase, putative [Halomonas citrativorans]